MKNKMLIGTDVRSIVKWLMYGVIAGVCIGIGGTVYLSVTDKLVGAFLFSLGLLTIVVFGFNLFTGKVGYIPLRKPGYAVEVLCTLLGNILGAAAAAYGVRLSRIGAQLRVNVHSSVLLKVNDSLFSSFILAVFCGVLMFIAVEGFRRCCEKGYTAVAPIMVMLPVAVFILCGFDHSVADMYYLFLFGFEARFIPYLLIVIFGNSVGGMLIPLALRVFDDR